MTTKFKKQEHLDELNHLTVIKLVLVVSSCYNQVTAVKFCYSSLFSRGYGHQIQTAPSRRNSDQIKTSFKDADDVLSLEHGNLNTINLFQQGHSHQIYATGLVKDTNYI